MWVFEDINYEWIVGIRAKKNQLIFVRTVNL